MCSIRHRYAHRLFAVAAFACVCMPVHLRAEAAADETTPKGPPKPSVALALEQLGYRPIVSNQTMRAGYANATLNFIDPEHLLFTFSARKLLKREPTQQEGDQDHAVIAEVIHLPDGKVVRQAEWRMHDHASYLWPLANGHFLLRIRGDIYSLDPMGSFNTEHLGQRELIRSSQQLEMLDISPERDLLMVETTMPDRVGDDPDEQKSHPVSVNFYKVEALPGMPVRLLDRGRASSPDIFSIAFTAMGVLQTVREDRTHWGFDFHAFSGKTVELAGMTSTCRPRSVFVSSAEFFAYGCRGGDDRKLMGGFNLLSEAKWVFTIDDAPFWVAVDTAPATGRFAVRNTLTNGGVPDQPDGPAGVDLRGQEVRVYGGREGEELLRVASSPTQRPSGNFALSPDGLKLAVMHDDQLEIYTLPAIPAADVSLHKKEQTALAPLRPAEDVDVASAMSRTSDQ